MADTDRQQWAYLYKGISTIATTLIALERSIARRTFGRVFGRVNRADEMEVFVHLWRR